MLNDMQLPPGERADISAAMKHRVDTLTGGLLDAAVAFAEGWELRTAEPDWKDEFGLLYTLHMEGLPPRFVSEHVDGGPFVWFRPESDPANEYANYSPTRDGNLCMDIMEREHIGVISVVDGLGRKWMAWGCSHVMADDPRTALCRAFVASKFGHEVELP